MKIGITLNETVRDFQATVEDVYEVFMDSIAAVNEDFEEHQHGSVSDMTETPIDAKSDSDFVLEKVNSKRETKLLFLPEDEDLFDISKKYEFEDEEAYSAFLYEDYAFQIFSRSGLIYNEAMMDLNTLYGELAAHGHTTTVVTQERKNSKQATLLFLSQNKFQCNNLKFLYNYSKIWEIYDLIITANPYIIASKPEGKLCLKINKTDNINLEADESFDDLLEVSEWFRKMKK